MDDGERIADGHRGIRRIAVPLQYVDADGRGEALGRDHHAVGGLDRRQGGGRQARGRGHGEGEQQPREKLTVAS